MDPLWSETCWDNFKYFIIILIVSTNYIFVHLLDNKLFYLLITSYFCANITTKFQEYLEFHIIFEMLIFPRKPARIPHRRGDNVKLDIVYVCVCVFIYIYIYI